jgi:3-keto-5-aminohexanoate cleavage enzyme
MEKIINLCPTGTQSTKQNSLAPIFANEVVDEVLSCYETGITMVHLHARDQNGENTYKKEYFQKIIEGIKASAPDLVICVSLSGRYVSDKSLRAEVLSLHPDLASLTMSSLNFPKTASINDPETIIWLIEEMDKYGVHPEIECFDSGMLNYTNYLLKKGILNTPLYINIILGNLFNAGTDISTIASLINNMPKDAKVCFGGIGDNQLKANIIGLLETDGIRIGLEDNFYYEKKDKATNQQLLSRIHRIMKEMGHTTMAPSALKALGYGNKRTNDIRV